MLSDNLTRMYADVFGKFKNLFHHPAVHRPSMTTAHARTSLTIQYVQLGFEILYCWGGA